MFYNIYVLWIIDFMDHEWHYSITFRFSHVRKLKMKYISVNFMYNIRYYYGYMRNKDALHLGFLFLCHWLDAWSSVHINSQYHVNSKQWLRTWRNMTYCISTLQSEPFLHIFIWTFSIRLVGFCQELMLWAAQKAENSVFEAVFVKVFPLTPVRNFSLCPIYMI